MILRFSAQITNKEYTNFAENHPQRTIFQSAPWAQVKKEWTSKYIGVYKGDQLILSSLVLIRPLILGFTFFYLPRGPLADYGDLETLDFFFKNLKRYAKKHKCILIKFDPNIRLCSLPMDRLNDVGEMENSKLVTEMQHLGAKHLGFKRGLYDYSQPRIQCVRYFDDEATEKLNPKTLRWVKKSRSKGVKLEVIGIDRLSEFTKLMAKTEERKGISLRNEQYYRRLLESFNGKAFLAITTLNQQDQLDISYGRKADFETQLALEDLSPKQKVQLTDQYHSIVEEINRLKENIAIDGDVVQISGVLSVRNDRVAEILYAGMDIRYKKYYATYVTYLAAIEWAENEGCKECNFGGVDGALSGGLYEFKSMFSPNVDEFIGEFDLPVNRLIYPLINKVPKRVKRIFITFNSRKAHR